MRAARFAFALALYITLYGFVGPNPVAQPWPKKLYRGFRKYVVGPIQQAAVYAYYWPNRMRAKFLIWRADTFGARLRSDIRSSRWGTLGGLGSATFDAIVQIANLTGLQAAAAALSASGGGTIYVQGPGTFNPTATTAIASAGAINNVDIYFSSGAVVTLAQGVEFPTTTGHTTGAIWTSVFEWANCSNCNIYNLFVTNLNTTSTHKLNLNAHHFGGNVQTLRFYDIYTKGFTRWMGHVTAYTTGVTGLGTQDGPVDDVIFIRPVCVNMGNTTTPDGGGLKIENQSGVAASTLQSRITNVGQVMPTHTGLNFSAFDVSYTTLASANALNVPAPDGGFFTDGGRITYAAGLSGSLFCLWVEQGLTNSYQTAIRKVWARNVNVDYNGSTGVGSTAVLDQCGADDTCFENITSVGATGSHAFRLTNSGNAPAHHTSGHTFRALTAQNCAGILKVDMGVGVANSFTSHCLFEDIRGIDGGQGNMQTGLTLILSGTAPLYHAVFRKLDCSRLAASTSTVAWAFTYAAHPLNRYEFQQCPGLSPIGKLPQNPFKSATALTVCGPFGDGQATNPTTATTYTVMFRTGCTIAVATATLSNISVTDEKGLPIIAFNEVNQARGSAAVPTTATTYTQTGQDMTWTFTQGGGSATVTITANDGVTVLYSAGTSSLTNAFVPAGSTIAVAGTVAGSTWTIKTIPGVTIANPFITGNTTTIAAQFVPLGGSITPTGTVGTWTVTAQTSPTSAFSTISTPFANVRVAGLVSAGGSAAPTSTDAYIVQGGHMIDNITGQGTVTHIEVVDEYGNVIQDFNTTTVYDLHFPPGCYFMEQATTIGTHTVSQAD